MHEPELKVQLIHEIEKIRQEISERINVCDSLEELTGMKELFVQFERLTRNSLLEPLAKPRDQQELEIMVDDFIEFQKDNNE